MSKNKGVEIRNKKLKRKSKKRYTVFSGQKGVYRFVKMQNFQVKRLWSGEYEKKKEEINGLQVENRVYYEKHGVLKSVYLNKDGCKILYNYPNLPDWAGNLLKEKYEQGTGQPACEYRYDNENED